MRENQRFSCLCDLKYAHFFKIQKTFVTDVLKLKRPF